VLCLIATTSFRNGKAVVIDGHSLSVPALVATARHNAPVLLNGSTEIRARIQTSRDVIMGKVETAKSVYGVSTGFGGSGMPDYDPASSSSY
jgi:phenylalanine ammonia-lyase